MSNFLEEQEYFRVREELKEQIREEVQEELRNDAVRVLNEAFELDKGGLKALFRVKVATNDALSDHPTIQVLERPDNKGTYTLGVLGLLNGILGVDENSCGFVAGLFDDETDELVGFSRYNAV